MLYVGSTDHLEELDQQLTLAVDATVSSIGSHPSVGALVLLDRERLAAIGSVDLEPRARLSSPAGQSMAVLPTGEALVGLEGAHLVLVAPDGSITGIDSFDELAGREGWENPAGPLPDLRSLAISPEGRRWYAGVHVGGVWRSDDRGSTWSEVIGAEADVHEVATGEGELVCVAAADGFGWSTDGGERWQWSKAGLHASYCRAVAVADEVVYLTASTGPSSKDGRLYRADLGADFLPCRNGLPGSFPFNLDTGTLAASGRQAAVGTRAGEVYRSFDGGNTWAKEASKMRPVQFLRFG